VFFPRSFLNQLKYVIDLWIMRRSLFVDRSNWADESYCESCHLF